MIKNTNKKFFFTGKQLSYLIKITIQIAIVILVKSTLKIVKVKTKFSNKIMIKPANIQMTT